MQHGPKHRESVKKIILAAKKPMLVQYQQTVGVPKNL